MVDCWYALVTCGCGGIHLESVSSIELATSRTEVPEAQRSCVRSQESFSQSFLHRAWPKTRVQREVSCLIWLSWSTSSVGLQLVPSTSEAVRYNRRSLMMSRSVAKPTESSLDELRRCSAAVLTLARNLRASRLKCGRYCSCQRPPASFCGQLTVAMLRNRRVESIALLFARHCPL